MGVEVPIPIAVDADVVSTAVHDVVLLLDATASTAAAAMVDPGVIGLLEFDPFHEGEERPKYIKVDKYRYEFYRAENSTSTKDHPYWEREYVGRVFPRQGVATAESLRDLIQ